MLNVVTNLHALHVFSCSGNFLLPANFHVELMLMNVLICCHSSLQGILCWALLCKWLVICLLSTRCPRSFLHCGCTSWTCRIWWGWSATGHHRCAEDDREEYLSKFLKTFKLKSFYSTWDMFYWYTGKLWRLERLLLREAVRPVQPLVGEYLSLYFLICTFSFCQIPVLLFFQQMSPIPI